MGTPPAADRVNKPQIYNFQKGKKKKVWKPQQQALPEPKMDIQIMSNRLSGRNAPATRGRKIIRGKKPEPTEPVAPVEVRAPSPVADDAAKEEVVVEERFEDKVGEKGGGGCIAQR